MAIPIFSVVFAAEAFNFTEEAPKDAMYSAAVPHRVSISTLGGFPAAKEAESAALIKFAVATSLISEGFIAASFETDAVAVMLDLAEAVGLALYLASIAPS